MPKLSSYKLRKSSKLRFTNWEAMKNVLFVHTYLLDYPSVIPQGALVEVLGTDEDGAVVKYDGRLHFITARAFKLFAQTEEKEKH